MFDGFPRTLTQAKALDALLTEQGVFLDAVLSYEMPLEEIVARLGGRRTCPACKKVYHLTTRRPRAEGVCDQREGRLVQREDDRPESIRVRMRAYEEATLPLTEYYGRSGRLVPVQASGTPEQILEHSLQGLSAHVAGSDERARSGGMPQPHSEARDSDTVQALPMGDSPDH